MKFTQLFPGNPVAKVIDYLATIYPEETTITGLIQGAGISSSTMYETVIPLLERNKLLLKHKLGKMTLYRLKRKIRISKQNGS